MLSTQSRRSQDFVVEDGEEDSGLVLFLKKVSDIIGSTQSMALDQVVSYRAMSALYRAGVSIVRALEILSSQTEHPRLRKAFQGLVRYIGSGMSVAAAMGLYPRVFPELYIHLIEVGEASGNMDVMLERLAQHAEKSNSSGQKLKSALVYPTFVFILCMLLLVFAPAFVFKGIFDLLLSLHVELPPITKGMIFVSNVMNSWWAFVIFGGIFFIGYAFLDRMQKSPGFRKFVQALLLKIPVLGYALRSSEVATFCRTLSTLYSAGVPMLRAIELSGKASGNLVLKEHIKEVSKDVANGMGLSEALQLTGFFPSMIIHLIAVGDETGALDRMLDRCAEIAEEIVQLALDAATAALEPMVLLMVGIVVGIVVIGTMAPLLKVVESL